MIAITKQKNAEKELVSFHSSISISVFSYLSEIEIDIDEKKNIVIEIDRKKNSAIEIDSEKNTKIDIVRKTMC